MSLSLPAFRQQAELAVGNRRDIEEGRFPRIAAAPRESLDKPGAVGPGLDEERISGAERLACEFTVWKIGVWPPSPCKSMPAAALTWRRAR